MKTLGEVFASQLGIKLPQQASQGELTQLDINKQARLITLVSKIQRARRVVIRFLKHGKS